MPKHQEPKRQYGDHIFLGFSNPSDQERPEALRGAGRLAVFAKQGQPGNQKHYMAEKTIIERLMIVEKLADAGVYEGRTIQHLFNAVKSGFAVNGTMRSAIFKPEDLYMMLDGMYKNEVRPVKPFGPSPARDL